MTVFCCSLMSFGVGVFTAFWWYGWFEAQSDRYAGIIWRSELATCIDWTLRNNRLK